MPEFNLPPIGWSESDAGKNHPFGCVGVTSFINGSYQLEHNSQGSLIDGLITFKALALSQIFCTFATALVLGGHASPQEIKRESGENPEQFPLL